MMAVVSITDSSLSCFSVIVYGIHSSYLKTVLMSIMFLTDCIFV